MFVIQNNLLKLQDMLFLCWFHLVLCFLWGHYTWMCMQYEYAKINEEYIGNDNSLKKFKGHNVNDLKNNLPMQVSQIGGLM